MKKFFAVDYYDVAYQDDYKMILDCFVVSEGVNRHKTFFRIETIEEAYPTLANIPILCLWDGFDFKEHARDDESFSKLKFVGTVPETNHGQIVEKDGKLWQKVSIIVWKAYNPELSARLATNQTTKISMEIDIIKEHEMDNGVVEIDEYIYCGICLLGISYTEAIPGAKVDVVKFSNYKQNAKRFNMCYSLIDIDKEYVEITDSLREVLTKQGSNPEFNIYLKEGKFPKKKLNFLINELDVFSKVEKVNKAYADQQKTHLEEKDKKKEEVRNLDLEKFKALFSEKFGDSMILHGCGKENVYAMDLNGKIYSFSYKGDKVDFSTKTEVFAKVDYVAEPEKDGNVYAVKEIVEKFAKKEEGKEGEKGKEGKEGKEDVETAKKFAVLDAEIEILKAENKKLKKYKDDSEKSKLLAKAKSLYAEHKNYLTDDEIKNFDKELFECKNFEEFEAKVSFAVLPKYRAKYAVEGEENTNKNEKNNSKDDLDIMALYSRGSIDDGKESKYDRNSMNAVLDKMKF